MVLITTSFEAIGAQALLERLAKLGSSVGAWAALTDGQSSLSRVDRKLTTNSTQETARECRRVQNP
jgi:hypothetical protein